MWPRCGRIAPDAWQRESEFVTTELPEGVNSVLEIVVNGLERAALEAALRACIEASCRPGVVEISAGNYGGKLGKHLFPLHALFGTGPA